MRNLIGLIAIIFSTTHVHAVDRYWVSTIARNWTDTNAWSDTESGPPGASVPVAGDVAYFPLESGKCTLVGDVTIKGMDVYTSVQIDLAGHNLTLDGDRWNVIEAGTFTNSGTTSFLRFSSVGTVQLGNSSGATTASFMQRVAVDINLSSGGVGTTYPGATLIYTAIFTENVSISCQSIELNGGTFNGNLTLTKTGASYDYSSVGGNTFNGATTITLASGAGDLALVNNASKSDTFNGDVTFTNNATTLNAALYPSYSGTTTFNGNIKVCSSSDGRIYFGYNASGTSVLANGKTISVGAAGYSKGSLTLNGFTQVGLTDQTIALTSGGTATLNIGTTSRSAAVTFNCANFTASAPSIAQIYSTTFNCSGSTTITAESNITQVSQNNFGVSGSTCALSLAANTNLSWNGGNFFYGNTTITNSGSAQLRLSATTKEMYYASVRFVKSGGGAFQAAWSQSGNEFMGDIDISGAVSFGAGGGTVNLTGTSNQIISGTASTIPLLTINKTDASDRVTLNTTISISSIMTFTNGLIYSSSSNPLVFLTGSSANSVSNSSHVVGPVQKVGKTVFDFPIGNGIYYRPLGLASTTTLSNTFTAEYKFTAPSNRTSLAVGVDHVSTCEYWTLARNSGSNAVAVKLSWNGAACSETVSSPYVTSTAALLVARYNGTSWVSEGNAGNTGTVGFGGSGTISTPTLSTFGNFTLGSSSSANPLPIRLVSFHAKPGRAANVLQWRTASEYNNKEFVIERSEDGMVFTAVGTTVGSGSSVVPVDYSFSDYTFSGHKNYYRLKQVDIDMKFTYSSVVLCINTEHESVFQVFPNPASGEQAVLNGCYDISIYDHTGSVIFRATQSKAIPLDDLTPGLYLIVNERGETVRFVVRK